MLVLHIKFCHVMVLVGGNTELGRFFLDLQMVNPFSKYRLGERDTQGCRLEDAYRGLLQYIVCCQVAEDAHYTGAPISFYIPVLLDLRVQIGV